MVGLWHPVAVSIHVVLSFQWNSYMIVTEVLRVEEKLLQTLLLRLDFTDVLYSNGRFIAFNGSKYSCYAIFPVKTQRLTCEEQYNKTL